jgi:hypothetical protein
MVKKGTKAVGQGYALGHASKNGWPWFIPRGFYMQFVEKFCIGPIFLFSDLDVTLSIITPA